LSETKTAISKGASLRRRWLTSPPTLAKGRNKGAEIHKEEYYSCRA